MLHLSADWGHLAVACLASCTPASHSRLSHGEIRSLKSASCSASPKLPALLDSCCTLIPDIFIFAFFIFAANLTIFTTAVLRPLR
ncbi:hypothetical protein BDV06DRAFT_70814 [Aspergillus oleicola]